MKKVLAIAVLGVLGLTSCKKDYTCTCTSASSPNFSYNENYKDQKKKDAEDLCDTRQTQVKSLYPDATCSL